MTEYSNHLAERTKNDVDLALRIFGHPSDVLNNPRLTREEKRTVLAAWASDANAIPHVPTLRQLPDGSIVKVDEILDALKALDEPEGETVFVQALPLWWQRPFKRNRGLPPRKWYRYGHKEDDDDDPPPCPAVIAPRPAAGGGAAFAVPEAVAA